MSNQIQAILVGMFCLFLFIVFVILFVRLRKYLKEQDKGTMDNYKSSELYAKRREKFLQDLDKHTKDKK